MDYPPRQNVLQVGSLDIGDIGTHAFQVRSLHLVRVDVNDVSKGLNEARAILIAEPEGRMGFVRSCFTSLKPLALDYGLAIAAIATSNDHFKLIQRLWRELQIGHPETIYPLQAIENAAEYIGHFHPGPPLGAPRIASAGSRLSSKVRHLLGRAFCDCDRIYLEPLGGGKVSLGVFCVHAWLKQSIVGPRPLPFFIKVDKPDRITRERQNYRQYADFYIPFYLRPNIDWDRCVDMQGLSAIVGNFVEDSRPLSATLRSNQGPGVLFSLFENSLKGFRAQPSERSVVRMMDLDSFVERRARATQIDKRTIGRSRELGLKSSPEEIEALLLAAIKGIQLPVHPCHGDLHSGNIMVRGKDAILIDLFSVEDGPLAADPAALEVSLVFGIDDSDRPNQFDRWRKFVNELYGRVPIHQPPLAEKRPDSFSWLRRAIREIRHVLLGCECQHREATAIIATYLIRFARLAKYQLRECAAEDNDRKDLILSRHAYALVVAERIVRAIADRNVTKGAD